MTQTQFIPQQLLSRKDLNIKSGDTVRVYTKIEEKGKTRTQMFEGLVLAVKHGNEAGATFTVRKVAHGVGVERIFPLYSPNIDKIEIVKRSHMRRSKLYFLRDKTTRALRRKMRNFIEFFSSSEDLKQEQQAVLEAMPDVVEETPTEAPAEETVVSTEEEKSAE